MLYVGTFLRGASGASVAAGCWVVLSSLLSWGFRLFGLRVLLPGSLIRVITSSSVPGCSCCGSCCRFLLDGWHPLFFVPDADHSTR